MSGRDLSAEAAESARSVIAQLWRRARINAFAHRTASEEAKVAASRYFRFEVVSAFLSMLCIILVFLLTTVPVPERAKTNGMAGWIMLMTILSVLFTLHSMFLSIMANYEKYEVRAAHHDHFQNTYQFIAQRAREVKWPDLPHEDVVELLRDLERDFALLKATGMEPKDSHFDQAHVIFKKIRNDPDASLGQSFDVGLIDRMAREVGEPKNALPSSKSGSIQQEGNDQAKQGDPDASKEPKDPDSAT